MKHLSVITLLFLFLYGCKENTPSKKIPKTIFKEIKFTNSNISTQGRVEKTDTSINLYWSASTLSLKFYGTNLNTVIYDENGTNDFEVIIDNDSSYLLDLIKGKQEYVITKLPLDTHTVSIFKRTEYDRGVTSFFGFKTENSAIILPMEKRQKGIVFYGNSITAAFSIDDYSGKDSPSGHHTNCYPGYAYQTAKHFNANYQLICKNTKMTSFS